MFRLSVNSRATATVRAIGLLAAVLMMPAADAQKQAGGLLDGAALFGNTGPAVDVEISAVLKRIGEGQTEIQVTATVPQGYYIYSMNRSFSGATTIKLLDTGTLKANKLNWQPDREPKVVVDKDLGETFEKYFDRVTWSAVLLGTATNETTVTGKLDGLFCSSPESGTGECIPIYDREFTAVLLADVTPPTGSSAAAVVKNNDKNPVTVIPKVGYGKKAKDGPMRFEITLSPTRPAVGQEVTLSIHAVLEEPWHTFALDQNPDMAGEPTVIELPEIRGLEPIDGEFVPSAAPDVERPLDDIEQRVHHHEITWSRRFKLSDSTAAIGGSIRFQMCSNGSCLPPSTAEFELSLTAADSMATDSLSAPGPIASRGTPVKSESTTEDETPKEGFFAFILAATVAGFVALLTPCVFPMIPVTVAFFLKQEEKRAGSSLKLAIIYSLSIVGAFTILGLVVSGIFGPTSLNSLANNRWLNLFFAGLFLLFSLMLLGVFDIQIPSWLLTWTSKRESAGGIIGVVFMALTFTLVSFTCTFAFVGSLLVWAAKGQVFWPVVGMLAFSTAFASPFFLLALFPSVLKRLPKSGGWMNDVKATMGIVELALVAKFLSVADIGFSVGSVPVFITYRIFMVSWIVLSLAAGVYLLGVIQKPLGVMTPTVKTVRNAFAVLFLAFAGYVTAGMYVHKMPISGLWNNIAAFAPPDIVVRNTDTMGFVISHHKLDYALEFEKAIAAAEKSNRPMFVDFTGVNCVNCRKMERSVLVDEAVLERLDKLVRAQLYTDVVPGIRDESLGVRLRSINRELQSDLLGDVTLPFYAVVSADGKTVLSHFRGLDTSGGEDFVKFLDKGLKSWAELRRTSVASGEVKTGH